MLVVTGVAESWKRVWQPVHREKCDDQCNSLALHTRWIHVAHVVRYYDVRFRSRDLRCYGQGNHEGNFSGLKIPT